MISDQEFNSLSPEDRERLLKVISILPQTEKSHKAAKTLLVHGFKPEFVAEYCNLPLKKVQQWYSESWNPRCRRPHMPPSEAALIRKEKINKMFKLGMNLEEIAKEVQVSVYLVWCVLIKQLNYTHSEVDDRLPPKGTRARQNFDFLYCKHETSFKH